MVARSSQPVLESLAYAILEEDFRIDEASDSFAEFVAKERSDLIGSTCFRVFTGQSSPCPSGRHSCPVRLAFQTGKSVTVENACRAADFVGHCRVHAIPLKAQNADFHQVMQIVERTSYPGEILQERGMLESERKYLNLFESILHGAYFTTREGRFIECNQAAVRMLGYDNKDDLLRINIPSDLYADPESRGRMARQVEEKGVISDFETVFKKKSGELLDVLLTVHGLRDQNGEIFAYQGLAVDVTEKRRLDRQLLQAEKMATLGRLAAGVAHEINNPLGGIHVFAHILKEKLPRDSPLQAHVEKIINESSRCKYIVKALLNFSRQTEPLFVPSDVNHVLEVAVGLFQEQALFQNIKVVHKLDAGLPEVIADFIQLQQVFANIMLNAAEAMEGHGILVLESRESTDRRFVEVVISDEGPGIPAADLEHIFEPFFSTKNPTSMESGTGLGLAISYGIVKNHGGTIRVSTQTGRGTSFTVSLPVTVPG